MTRKEGIIKRYKEPENHKMAEIAGSIQTILDTEYKNYTELCHYCYEVPKSKEDWLSETINAVRD